MSDEIQRYGHPLDTVMLAKYENSQGPFVLFSDHLQAVNEDREHLEALTLEELRRIKGLVGSGPDNGRLVDKIRNAITMRVKKPDATTQHQNERIRQLEAAVRRALYIAEVRWREVGNSPHSSLADNGTYFRQALGLTDTQKEKS